MRKIYTIAAVAFFTCYMLQSSAAPEISDGAEMTNIYDIGMYGDSVHDGGVDLMYGSYLGSNQTSAFSAATEVSNDLAKLNLTASKALTESQRVKLTYEIIRESKDIDFYTGTVSKDLYQNSVGAAYSFRFSNPYMPHFEVSAAYTRSGSKKLSAKTVESSEFYNVVEQRNIAGATVLDYGAKVGFKLWDNSSLHYGAYYRDVDFRQINSKKTRYKTLWHSVEAEQVLLNKFKVKLTADLDDMDKMYQVNLGYFIPTTLGYALEVLGVGTVEDNRYISKKTYQAGAKFNFMLGLDKDAGYSSTLADNQSSLLSWTTKPVVTYSAVFAVKDAAIDFTNVPGSVVYPELYSRSMNRKPPIYVYKLSKTLGTGYATDGWKVSRLDDGFVVNDSTRLLMNYDPQDKKATAIYITNSSTGTKKLHLEMDDVVGAVGDRWYSYPGDSGLLGCDPVNNKDCWVIVKD